MEDKRVAYCLYVIAVGANVVIAVYLTLYGIGIDIEGAYFDGVTMHP
jgi:hypothetical protein